jgi:hypothetical protein
VDAVADAILAPQPGDSREPRDAEAYLIDGFAERNGLILDPGDHRFPDGTLVRLDGFSADPPVLVEAWAHLGPPKSAQKHKVMTDALKLVWAEAVILPGARKVLVLADDAAARHFLSGTWMAAALRHLAIEVEVVPLPDHIAERVRAAQRRQYR